jgi:hypothetical protein
MDNASANTTMMQELGRMFKEDSKVDFDATDRQIMCYAHVINLSSGRVVRAASRAATVNKDDNDDDDDSWSEPLRPPPYMPDQQSYDDAVARDPIALGRSAVHIIRASGTRHAAFKAVIADGNQENWFIEGEPPNETIVQVKDQELLRDVCTRWDSVYHMLSRLRELRLVSFSGCDHPFLSN